MANVLNPGTLVQPAGGRWKKETCRVACRSGSPGQRISQHSSVSFPCSSNATNSVCSANATLALWMIADRFFSRTKTINASLMSRQVAGVPLKVVSECLGHESPAFTLKQYAHVVPGMQAEAASQTASLVADADRTHVLYPPMGVVDSSAMERSTTNLRVVGLFAGIGGIELGLERAGCTTELLCEIDDSARRVLKDKRPDVPLHDDVRTLDHLPDCDLLTAGFPCQDLSQAGRTEGISGSRSGLVGEVFRLLDQGDPGPRWLLLENVSFMLSLGRGAAMRWLTNQLEARGFNWAYRVVDSRAFGLPQRRQRVLLLASREADPRPVLFNQDEAPNDAQVHDGTLACGFYWTEGLRGLGWAINAVPTLKGGSTIGIPSPPAIWFPKSRHIGTPDIRDAERMQGFEPDWTAASDEITSRRRTDRWKLVGNAVSVPVAEWLGGRLGASEDYSGDDAEKVGPNERWPRAAWGRAGEIQRVDVSMWPVTWDRPHLHEFLQHETTSLSARATAGFLDRTRRGNLRISEDLIRDAEAHLESMTAQLRLIAA